MMKYWLVLAVLLSYSSTGQGLKCYVCTSSDVSFRQDCELGNRTAMASVECPGSMKYCTYTKTQWATISGANSVLRECSDEPQYKNGQQDLQGGNLTIWYEYCGFDYCNDATRWAKGSCGLVVTLTIASFILAHL